MLRRLTFAALLILVPAGAWAAKNKSGPRRTAPLPLVKAEQRLAADVDVDPNWPPLSGPQPCPHWVYFRNQAGVPLQLQVGPQPRRQVAAGRTAAALHGFDGFALRPPFQIMVERGHNIARVGHRIHTTNSLELIDRAWAQGVPVLTPARTLLHLAEREKRLTVIHAINSATRATLPRHCRFTDIPSYPISRPI